MTYLDCFDAPRIEPEPTRVGINHLLIVCVADHIQDMKKNIIVVAHPRHLTELNLVVKNMIILIGFKNFLIMLGKQDTLLYF